MSVSLRVGQVARVQRALEQSDLDRFAALSGDDNPIHVDEQFSASTRFGRTVAHGMFLYGCVCGAINRHLTGPGMVQWEQELMFPAPTFADEQVEIQVQVDHVDPAQRLAELSMKISKPDGSSGLDGRTMIQLPGEAAALRLRAEPAQAKGPPPGKTFKGFHIGQRAETRRRFTEKDLTEYCALVGDPNPLFRDARYAQRHGLPSQVIPGSLLGGLFSYLLGTQLPGRGTNYLKQRLVFARFAHAGEEIEASVEITRLRPEKQLINLSTLCANGQGQTLCWGEALVLVRDVGA